MILLCIVFSTFSCAAKFVMAVKILTPDQRDSVHLMAIASYAFITELTAVVTFQFIFFSFSAQRRFEVFVKILMIDLKLNPKCQQNTVKMYSNQYTILTSIIEKINATFSIQVNEFKRHLINIY